MSFHYESLTEGCKAIRVLELHPGRKGDGIACSLKQCSFPPGDGAVYEPLSYCWGDARNKAPITVDGVSVEVTRNLHAALLRLRLEDEDRRLWVDAICINQDDDDEKAIQVQMMKDIYQQGIRTLVWLGPASSWITRGFSIIPNILKTSKVSKEKISQGASPASVELSSHYTPKLSQFLAIFELPYFTRVWVIQEVAVSPSLEVFCGHHSISWDSLIDAADTSFAFGMDMFQEKRSLALFWDVVHARTSFQSKIKQTLLEVLIDHRGTSATDTKDKIYALLGLLDHEELESLSVVPNYQKEYTAIETYIDTANSILRTTGNLDLLSVPSTLESDLLALQLPTWVPDWSKPPSSFPLIRFSNSRSFAATGSSTSDPIFRNQGKLVGLAGYIFDEVEFVGYASADRPAPLASTERTNLLRRQFSSNMQFWFFETQNLRAWKNWLHVICSPSRGAYVTGEPMLDAFWTTFIGGYALEDDDDIVEFRRTCEDLVGHRTGPSGLFDHSAFWIPYCIAASGYKRWRDTIRRIPPGPETPFLCAYGRSMFTTKDGYIGLGPKDMQKGDFIGLLEGGQMPYVLRRKGEIYELIGDCYVHGIMQGEHFDKTRCELIWIG
ncbi:hypothetical protein EG329_010614 [Mollisiaceae sp. DMI_Dod_QoI]|nr:hypothetical protein EG329_010614 [Helotiales sp. DMI_Dod_QoI]